MNNLSKRACGIAVASLLAVGGIALSAGSANAAPAPAAATSSASTQAVTVSVTTTEYLSAAKATKVTGTATPNSLVGLLIGGKSYDTTATKKGVWNINVKGLSLPSYTGTAFAVVGGETSEVSFTLTSDAVSTSPAAPVVTTKSYNPNAYRPTITGTATPGALVGIEFGTTSTSVKADESGAWSYTVPGFLWSDQASGDVRVTVYQIVGGQSSPDGVFTLTVAK